MNGLDDVELDDSTPRGFLRAECLIRTKVNERHVVRHICRADLWGMHELEI